jgi:hypothetical protein
MSKATFKSLAFTNKLLTMPFDFGRKYINQAQR